MNIFIDTNIILDVLTKREPFYPICAKIWTLVTEKIISGYISAISVNNIYYILRKLRDKTIAKNFVEEVLRDFNIVPLTREILLQASKLEIEDYEDGIHYFSVIHCGCEYLVTRNKKDYPTIGLMILSPEEFVENLKKEI